MKVIVNDQHLTNIANAIRELNGSSVSYKAREMSAAIDALPELTTGSHSFRVTINQSPHQTIIVSRYLDDDTGYHVGSFNVSEQFYKLNISIEADEGYTAGTLNKSGVVTLDRDMLIEATPATPIGE